MPQKFDITEKFIRARQRDPGDFQKESFRTINLSSGVKAIVGRLKGETTTTIQSILFDKERFTTESAQKWLNKNNSRFQDAIGFEEQKIALFQEDALEMLREHLQGHLPPLSQTQIQRLIEVAGPPSEEESTNQFSRLQKYASID